MIWIELLGPAGIGKSFLYNKLRERNIVNSTELSGFNNCLLINNKFVRAYLTKKFYKDLNCFKTEYSSVDALTNEVFNKGLDTYTNDSRIKNKLQEYYHYKFKELKFLDHKLKKKDVFFSEDGIVHLNYGITQENINEILKPDFIISLTASDEFINNNRIKRINSQKGNIIEKQTSIEVLQHTVFPKNIRLYKEKTEVLKKVYKDRFFEINVEVDDVDLIVSKIEEIIKWIKN